MKELIDYDPINGISEFLIMEPGSRQFKVRREQDVEPILDANKRMQNDPDYKREGIKRNFQHFAHIPEIVYLQWLKEGIDALNPHHIDAVKRKLRDPEYRHLRTTLGGI